MIAGIFDRLLKKKVKSASEDELLPPSDIELPGEFEDGLEFGGAYETPRFLDIPPDLEMDSSINYNFGRVEYRLKLHNITNDMLGDIDVHLRTDKKAVINVIDSKQVIEMLEPGKSINLKFGLKPRYKLGKSGIYGKVEYFDFKSKERKIFRLPQAHVKFAIKELQADRIDEDKWRLICGGLKSFEIETAALDSPPGNTFNIFKKALSNLGLFMLPPIENVNLYRGIARFYGFADENQYAVETQVIGDRKHSKVLFRVWSNEPQTAMAISFKTISIVDSAIKIKKFIVET